MRAFLNYHDLSRARASTARLVVDHVDPTGREQTVVLLHYFLIPRCNRLCAFATIKLLTLHEPSCRWRMKRTYVRRSMLNDTPKSLCLEIGP